MDIAIITPHWRATNQYLVEAYASLCAQDWDGRWTWVIVKNNGGEIPPVMAHDERIVACNVGECPGSIGWLKWYGALHARAELLVELDADDLLTPDALRRIAEAFQDDGVQFVYSNWAEFHDHTWQPNVYNDYYGWKTRPYNYLGHELTQMVAFEPSPHALRYVYWSPNHVRAWRRTAYEELGGHDATLGVGDDHDLVCRTYLKYGAAGMRHIDDCLYLYRVHDNNTTKIRNAEIQQATVAVYARYIRKLVERWCRDLDLPMVDLGCGTDKPEGYFGLDCQAGAGIDHVCDLAQGIPVDDNSVGLIRAYDFVEHLADPVRLMNEIYRVLVPGGWLFLSVPSTDGRGAWQDPTHKSFWNENSLWYYTDPQYARFVPHSRARFQLARAITWYPTEWHEAYNISYVDAQLIAVKSGYEPIGECLWRGR